MALNLLKNEQHDVTINSSTGAQFLSIQVENIQNQEPLFTIRLNALDYADMVDRLQSPINNVRGIIINQVFSFETNSIRYFDNFFYHFRMFTHVSVKCL